MIQVGDPGDPRLADYLDLRSAGAPPGVVITEGELVIRSLLRSPLRVRSVLVTPARHASLLDVLDGLDAPVYVAPLEVLRAVVGFDIHRGGIASAERPVPADPGAVLDGARLVVVTEGLNDLENLGALFRGAAAFGADAVLLDPTTADPLARRPVRVSIGHALHVPFARLDPWPDGLALVRDAGFELVALTPSAAAEPVQVLDGLDRVALLVGAEGPGLSPVALAAADRRVRIPMAPGVDSLNVATAAAVALSRLSRLT